MGDVLSAPRAFAGRPAKRSSLFFLLWGRRVGDASLRLDKNARTQPDQRSGQHTAAICSLLLGRSFRGVLRLSGFR